MKKIYRFLLILLLLAVGAIFLYPTWKWYFDTTEAERVQVSKSKSEIRDDAMLLVEEDIEQLKKLANKNPNAKVPQEFQHLIDDAKSNYQEWGQKAPQDWTMAKLLNGFNPERLKAVLLDVYFSPLLGLKDLREKTLKLGLDLRGGMSVVLRADEQSLEKRNAEREEGERLSVSQALDMALITLNSRIDKFGVTEPDIRKLEGNSILIEIPGAVDKDRVNSFLMGKGSLRFQIVAQEKDEVTAISNIVSKINKLTSKDFYGRGSSVIPMEIQKNVFEKTILPELSKTVQEQISAFYSLNDDQTQYTLQTELPLAEKIKLGRVLSENSTYIRSLYDQPRDTQLRQQMQDAGLIVRNMYEMDKYGMIKEEEEPTRMVLKNSDEYFLDGSHIVDARKTQDPNDMKPLVAFRLDAEGSKKFGKITKENKGEYLAIVMDDKIKSAPVIKDEIPNGRGTISGVSADEAKNLALVLKTAAMPIDLKIENFQAVGASLGEDSIRTGLFAIVLGFALVILFMMIWYKGSGFVADIALLFNLYFIIAILSVFSMTLTLTSIAGLILTVGMAVDANVIIFERIKEEWRLGKSASASVKAGFGKAFWTIMDANITTFIAALVLSYLGSGSIAGFAVTLAVGILSSMFCSLFLSRLLFDFGLESLKIKKLSISWRRR